VLLGETPNEKMSAPRPLPPIPAPWGAHVPLSVVAILGPSNVHQFSMRMCDVGVELVA
jgi:hypothetical protein